MSAEVSPFWESEDEGESENQFNFAGKEDVLDGISQVQIH
jgi:hypothetical protein